MKQILFVDDEPRVLQGLRRMLHNMTSEWTMEFAGSAEQALEILAQTQYDVVVTDMRMPGMDGAQLLNEVTIRHPQTVRIILSGQSDEESVLRCIGQTHQFLAKPCNSETLISTVSRACALRELLSSSAIKKLVSQMKTLPSLPSLYTELMNMLKSPDTSVQSVATVVSQDVGMVTKILQLVNSAFFGFYQHTTCPERAVSILGLKTIGALVLSAKLFSEFHVDSMKNFDIDEMNHHSTATGTIARAIAGQAGCNPAIIDDAMVAGLLHDVGKIVLAFNLPVQYQEAIRMSIRKDIPIWRAEYEVFHASHAEVGAYLLGLWGLPDSVVEAIAYHHGPSKCANKKFSPLTVVHIADAIDHERHQGSKSKPRLEKRYLDDLDCLARLAEWRKMYSIELRSTIETEGYDETQTPDAACASQEITA